MRNVCDTFTEITDRLNVDPRDKNAILCISYWKRNALQLCEQFPYTVRTFEGVYIRYQINLVLTRPSQINPGIVYSIPCLALLVLLDSLLLRLLIHQPTINDQSAESIRINLFLPSL
jgi:hypothetical protein